MRKVLFSILLAATFIACSHKPNEGKTKEGELVSINISQTNQIAFSELFDSVSYIPLETTDEALVGIVEHMRLFGDYLCLICDKNVLIFNVQTGKALSQISKFGNGPGEYQSLYDIFVDDSSNVELLDKNGRKIRKYDFEGNFLSETSLPSMSFAFTKEGNHYWLYNNNLEQEKIAHKVLCYDASAGEITEEFFPMDKTLSRFFFVLEGNNFVRTEDALLFFANPQKQLFLLKENSLPEVAYTLDFGKHSLPESFLQEKFTDIMDFSQRADSREYVYFVNSFAANQQNLQISFWLGEQIYWSFYSKAHKSSETACQIKDDLNEYLPLQLKNTNSDAILTDKYFYFLLSAEQFLKISGKKGAPTDNLTDQSNPILVKCVLKKAKSR